MAVAVAVVGGGGYPPTNDNTKNELNAFLKKIELDTSLNKNKCLSDVISKVLSMGSNGNVILNFIKKMGLSQNLNLTFTLSENTNLNNVAVSHIVNQGASTNGGVTLDATITFYNPAIAGSTQLYMVSYLFHEVMHAYIDYQILSDLLSQNIANLKTDIQRLGSYIGTYEIEKMLKEVDPLRKRKSLLDTYNTYKNDYDHNLMATNEYIQSLSSAIKDFDGGRYSDDFYSKLAYGGLQNDDVVMWKNLDQTSKADISNVLNTEHSGGNNAKGTKCN